jgi:penicillin-binding protein 1A
VHPEPGTRNATIKIMRRFATAIACAVAAAALASGCSYTPTPVVPQIPANAQSSKIFAADGALITTLHGPENRIEVPLQRISQPMQQAVIAIEDERFYYHHGVDIRAIARAARTNAEAGTIEQGGSTITQQLVKNTLLSAGKTLDRKVQEAALAWQLENHYSKQRILEIYLNTVYFGNGAYGVEAAAEQYFAKPIEQIGIVEAATIAGLIQAPNDYDPIAHPNEALARRNTVLDKLAELGDITQAERDFGVASPLGIAPTPTAERYPAAHFVDEVKKFVETDPRFGATPEERRDLLYEGGLRIYTTIDLPLQAAAEAAVAQVMPARGPQAALVSVDPQTGFVRAMVGGADYFGSSRSAQFNLAMGKGRGTGSAFKPIVLATALAQGIPLSEVLAAPPTITLGIPGSTVPWNVHNADPGEGAPGGTNLVEGTVHSFNTLFAQLILQVGPKNAIDMAHRMGITTPLQAVPAAVLGSNDVQPLEMASVYGTLANRGVHVEPIMVTRITKANGAVLYEDVHQQSKAMDATVADTVTTVLQQVVARGTGTAAQLDRPVAGKTGTGEDYKNAWFCGYTPTLSTAVWAGYPESEVQMTPPTTSITVYGGTWPAQIWQRFMTAATAGTPAQDFAPPQTTTTTTTQPPVATSPTTATQVTAAASSTVPSVVGLSADDAASRLSRSGFVVERVDTGQAGTAGLVKSQSPTAGTMAASGSAVTVVVAPT